MAFFTNAQGFEITGGQFQASTTNITNNSSGPTGIDILREASTPGAAHDSSARAYPPQCFPGTREQYIEDFTNWAVPAVGDTPLPLFWMRGPAGVGKTAIAQTCAERLKRQKQLGAAFFFSINGRNQPQKFFPSIAYQLATIHPAYRNLIERKIREDRTLVDKTMESQYHALIIEPLLELEADGKGVGKRIPIFVDGLDECKGVDAQCEIIRIVSLAARDSAIPLCWAFFSRPEPQIEATFAMVDVTGHTRKVELPISRDTDGEITLYLRASFENILQRRKLFMHSMWPSESDMKTLVGAASGSFIYATTVLRFVANLDALGPEKRLRLIIDVILERVKRGSGAVESPFAELDAFYMLIMQRIPQEILLAARLLLNRLSRPDPWSAMLLANVTGLSKVEFDNIYNQLSSVIHFRDAGYSLKFGSTIDTTRPYTETAQSSLTRLSRVVASQLGGVVSLYHKSFMDFLLDPKRSGRYYVRAPGVAKPILTDLHLDIDKSYCWNGSELVLAPGFPDSASSLSYPFTNELVNSMLKARVYSNIAKGGVGFISSYVGGREGTDCDLRKSLHVCTSVYRARNLDPDAPFLLTSWHHRCHSRAILGTLITWLRGGWFRKFDIPEFKQVLKQRERTGFIRRYHTDFISQLKSLFPGKSNAGVESGLYRVGRGEKAIYWFWEINYELQYYRGFQTIDLAKGQEAYRKERFDLWPRAPTDAS